VFVTLAFPQQIDPFVIQFLINSFIFIYALLEEGEVAEHLQFSFHFQLHLHLRTTGLLLQTRKLAILLDEEKFEQGFVSLLAIGGDYLLGEFGERSALLFQASLVGLVYLGDDGLSFGVLDVQLVE